MIGESTMALVLIGCFLEKFGGDHLEETRRNYLGFQDGLKQFRPGGATSSATERPPEDAT